MPNLPANRPGDRLPIAASSKLLLTRSAISLAGTNKFWAPATLAAMKKDLDTPETRRALVVARETVKMATCAQIITHLTALSIHYWTPTLSEDPAEAHRLMKLKFRDFCSDLKGVTEQGIIDACTTWRRGTSDWFPKPGQIRALCLDDINGRLELERGLDAVQALIDGTHEPEPPRGKLRSAAEILQEHAVKRRV